MTDKTDSHCGEKEIVKFAAGQINYPPDGNGKGDVLNPMPMMVHQGALCRATGKSPSAPSYQVVQVLVKVVQDPNAAPTGDPMTWMMTNPVATFTPSPLPALGDGATYDLVQNPNLQASTDNSQNFNNKIFVAALLSNGGMPSLSSIDSAQFKGTPVSTCTGTLQPAQPAGVGEAQAHAAKTCSGLASSSSGGPALVYGQHDCSHESPSGCHHKQRDWFKFDALSVANPDGNWLHLHKRPLRARTIAVAARDVCWKTDPRSALVLRRPSGLVRDDKNLEVFPFRFPQFPPHCIVVYQPGSGLMHLVVSECVDHPDIVSLDPNFDVLVFVNDRFWGYADNTGSFSLSVAVVDAL